MAPACCKASTFCSRIFLSLVPNELGKINGMREEGHLRALRNLGNCRYEGNTLLLISLKDLQYGPSPHIHVLRVGGRQRTAKNLVVCLRQTSSLPPSSPGSRRQPLGATSACKQLITHRGQGFCQFSSQGCEDDIDTFIHELCRAVGIKTMSATVNCRVTCIVRR